jgi:hypothetical protein
LPQDNLIFNREKLARMKLQFEKSEPQNIECRIWKSGMVQLLQEFPEPWGIDEDDIDQKKGCQRQKEYDKVD